MTDLAARLTELLPQPGQPPPRATEAPRERRVLQWHLTVPGVDSQTSMADALRSLVEAPGDYARLDICSTSFNDLLQAVEGFQPSLVFAQVQRPDVLPVSGARWLKDLTSKIPDCVTVFWNGDVGGINGPTWNTWYSDLGIFVDLLLHESLFHVHELRRRGVTNAGFLQVAADNTRYWPATDEEWGSERDCVFLFNSYGKQIRRGLLGWNQEGLRHELAAVFAEQFPRGHYGGGIAQDAAGPVYRTSKLALSCSAVDAFDRSTSDRLFRALVSGCCVLVKQFKDCESLGLVNGSNCCLFETVAEAVEIANEMLVKTKYARSIGRAGAKLVQEQHTWLIRMRELAPLVDAVRASRSPQQV